MLTLTKQYLTDLKEVKMNLPKDPYMLLSFVNTKLRDEYSSFEEFCNSFEVDLAGLESVLNKIDYFYDSKTNQFI